MRYEQGKQLGEINTSVLISLKVPVSALLRQVLTTKLGVCLTISLSKDVLNPMLDFPPSPAKKNVYKSTISKHV